MGSTFPTINYISYQLVNINPDQHKHLRETQHQSILIIHTHTSIPQESAHHQTEAIHCFLSLTQLCCYERIMPRILAIWTQNLKNKSKSVRFILDFCNKLLKANQHASSNMYMLQFWVTYHGLTHSCSWKSDTNRGSCQSRPDETLLLVICLWLAWQRHCCIDTEEAVWVLNSWYIELIPGDPSSWRKGAILRASVLSSDWQHATHPNFWL